VVIQFIRPKKRRYVTTKENINDLSSPKLYTKIPDKKDLGFP
jgi:hypothetical protein